MLFAMVSALPALAVVAVQFALESHRTSQQAIEDAAAIADRLESDLGKMLASVESVVHAVGTLGTGTEVSTAQCSAALQRAMQTYGNAINFSITSADGRVLCSAMPVPPGLNFKDRPYFRQVLETGQTVLSGYTIGRVTGKSAVQLAVPLTGADGQVKAVAIAAIETSGLIPRLVKSGAEAVTVALLDRDGVLISRVPQPLPPGMAFGKSFSEAGLFRALTEQARASVGMEGLDGVKRLYELRQVMHGQQVALYLAVGTDVSALTAEVRRVSLWYVLAVLATAAVVVWVAIAATRPLVIERARPMLDVAQRASRGDYTGRVPIMVRDDLTPIEDAINAMLASMEADKARVLALSERNRLIAEATNDAIYDWNLEAGTFWCNRLPLQPVRGDAAGANNTAREDWLRTIHADDRSFVRASLDEAISRGDRSWQGRYRVSREDGGCAQFVEQARLVRNDSGALTRIVSGARDVSDEMRAELALRDSEARYRLLFENSMDGVLQTTAEGRILNANAAFCAMLGRTEAELQALGREGVVDPGDPRLPLLLQLRLKHGRVRGELRMVKADGTTMEAELTSSMYVDRDGREVASMVVRDNTDKKLTEEKIHQLNRDLEARVRSRTEQLQNANRELEAFSYSVSHDLRGPLSTLSGFSKLLENAAEKEGNPRTRHLTQRIRAAARDMGELIEGLLSLASVSRTELRRDNVDFGALARAVVGECREREPQRQVAVQVDEGLACVGDARLLKAVLTNLIGNAWKFTAHTEGAAIHVGQQADAGNERVFFVRDNGAGFDMAYADKLFGPFQRLHSGAEYPGSGVGLATVQRIVQRHGGKVWAQARPGHGATFFFTLNASEY